MSSTKAKLPAQLKMISIDKIVPAPWNFKQDDEDKARKLAENIRRNGQIKNCNVRQLEDGRYEMIDGNHRLIAFKELGIKQVLAYDHGPISQEEAIRIAHEVVEYFEVDPIKQAEALQIVLDGGISLEDFEETVPWNMEELNDVRDLIDFDWDRVAAEAEEGSASSAITLSFVVRDEVEKETIMSQIERIADLCGFGNDRKGHGRALLYMAEIISRLEDRQLA